jgi:hypothetical protein
MTVVSFIVAVSYTREMLGFPRREDASHHVLVSLLCYTLYAAPTT